MAKNNHETETNGINIIGVGTDISGDIVSNGDIRVDGGLNGKLSTKGKVVVGVTGKVKGEINCKNSDVEGYIEGKITVVQLLSLKATAQINGVFGGSQLDKVVPMEFPLFTVLFTILSVILSMYYAIKDLIK